MKSTERDVKKNCTVCGIEFTVVHKVRTKLCSVTCATVSRRVKTEESRQRSRANPETLNLIRKLNRERERKRRSDPAVCARYQEQEKIRMEDAAYRERKRERSRSRALQASAALKVLRELGLT